MFYLPKHRTYGSPQPITVRRIGDHRNPFSEYVILDIYIDGKDDKGNAENIYNDSPIIRSSITRKFSLSSDPLVLFSISRLLEAPKKLK